MCEAVVMATTDPSSLPFLRRRVTATVFVAVAAGLTGMFAALTVAPLIAQEVAGSTSLSGIPSASAIAGTAAAAVVLSRVMAGRGRRRGLVVGFVVACGGVAVATVATLAESFLLLVVGMFAAGAGNSACLLARYAVADVHPAARRSSVVGFVMWAGTVGAVVGPTLIEPAGSLVSGAGLPALTGGLVVALAGFSIAAMLCGTLPRPGPPVAASDPAVPHVTAGGVRRGALRGVWRRPGVQVALAAMVAGQFVMVIIMTMTPLHVRTGGHSLAVVGGIMSAHIMGMYAFTPLLGRVADRVGAVPVITAGLALLVASGLLGAAAGPADALALGAALFVLGLGWSAGFVAASGVLSVEGTFSERARIQGAADSLVFASAAVASTVSGVLLATIGYTALCLFAAALVVLPAAAVARDHRSVRLLQGAP